MSVRLQFFTVVVPLQRIRAIPGLEGRLTAKYGGFADEHLWSVSSMSPPREMAPYLESEGLVPREMVNGIRTWRDMCVVDYYEGPTNPCPWLEIDMSAHVAWLKGTAPGALVGPTPHEPAPPKWMPETGWMVPGAPGPSSAPAPRAASPSPDTARVLADARQNGLLITVLYAVLSAVALGAVIYTDLSRWMTGPDVYGYATYHPHLAGALLFIPLALAAYRLFVATSLGPDALLVHYRPLSLEMQEGRVLGSIMLTLGSLYASGNEDMYLWAPWMMMPFAAFMLAGWDSTIVQRGSYRPSPLFRPMTTAGLEIGFVIVRGRGPRVALFSGRYPIRPLTQVANETEAVTLALHLDSAFGIPPALKRPGEAQR